MAADCLSAQVSGHYMPTKTVCENLRLPSNILSRFDLVFVLLDRPNEQVRRPDGMLMTA